MMTYIALLRAINVGGKYIIAMTALKAMFEALGFENARTLLQSGNVLFDAPARKTSELESLLEAETTKRLKADPDYFVRTAREWNEALAHNPFSREAKSDPGRLIVMALKAEPSPAELKALQVAIKGRETVTLWKRHAYVYFPDGSGNSKLTPRLIETKLGTRATGRNWNTAQKLLALAES
jgi:uncharacterized protein (DUF1697 family)